MFRNTKFLAGAFLGLGLALGYAAASGKLNPFQKAEATTTAPSPIAPAVDGPACPVGGDCCGAPDKAAVLAAVNAHNQKVAANAQKDGKKPNILVIWGDDIGQSNISVYSHGVMGYKTPNIDRIAKEGVMFTDYYAEQSCTAGRASFITGQHGLRTGLTKVGLPGATLGLQKEDPTSRRCSSHSATRPASSARTTSATATSSCPPFTGSTSSTATSTTSTRKKNRNCRTTRRIPRSGRSTARAACSIARPRTRTTLPWTRGSARSASRSSRTPARSRRSGWRPSTTTSRTAQRSSSSGRRRPASRSLCG